MDGIYNRIIEKEVLKELQDKFCAIAQVYAMCLDSEGAVLTEMSGERGDIDRLERIVSREQMYSLYRRVEGSSLEDQAVEETENEAVKYAAVCIKDQGRPVITWLVCAVLSDIVSEQGKNFAESFVYQTTLSRFNLALDLLREASRQIVCHKVLVETAWIQSRRSQYSREEMEVSVRRMEATTEVVQMLESDAPIEEVMMAFLKSVGTFLKIDNAYLCTVEREDSDTMDVIAQWSGEGETSSLDQAKNQPRPAYLYREKPLVISSASGREGYDGELKKAGLTALAVMPVTVKDKISMYACFEMKEHSRNWNLEEIKFLNDSVKVLQSILTRRRYRARKR